MHVECICNDGFEDQLTKGKVYRVTTETKEGKPGVGENSYFIETDRHSFGWYGMVHFKPVII